MQNEHAAMHPHKFKFRIGLSLQPYRHVAVRSNLFKTGAGILEIIAKGCLYG